MSDQQDLPQDEALAAEYVLRLLDAGDAQAFEARLQDAPALQAQVYFWEAELAAIAHDLPDEIPPASVKSALLGRIEGQGTAAKRGWSWGWSWGWMGFPGLVAVAIAAFFIVTPMLRGPDFDPTLHATLISENGALHIEAGYAPDGNLFKVIPEEGAPAPGRDFELWVIGAEAAAPVSLGVIPSDRVSLFEITPELAALIDGGTLAVSDEPAGGSPTGAPTGAILASDVFFDAALFQPG